MIGALTAAALGQQTAATLSAARRYAFVEKYARCISDPAFGWHFVESFLVTRCGFPVEAFDNSLFRAFYWKRQELCFDASVTEAMSIALPQEL